MWRRRRRPRTDTGAFAGEYIALGALAAILLAGLVTIIPGDLRDGAGAVVCRVLHAGGDGGRDSCATAPPAVRCAAFCATRTNPIHPSDPVTAATKGDYAALGDSYASGEGANGHGTYLPGSVTDRCHRAPHAFAMGLRAQFAFKGTNPRFVACSGATTTDLADGAKGEPPQLAALGPRTTTVTLTVGGNDLHFVDVIKTCLTDLHLSLKFWDPPKQDQCHAKGPAIDADMTRLFGHPPDPSRYQRTLEAIHARAPNARILVSGYPRLFPDPPAKGYLTLTKDDQAFLNARTLRLNATIARQVQQEDDKWYGGGRRRMGSFEYVDTTQALSGHEIGTGDPWLNGLKICKGGLDRGNPNCHGQWSGSVITFHPTEDGQRAIQRAFARELSGGPGRVLWDP